MSGFPYEPDDQRAEAAKLTVGKIDWPKPPYDPRDPLQGVLTKDNPLGESRLVAGLQNQAKITEAAPKSSRELRQYCLELVTRTNMSDTHYNDPVVLAQKYEAYILGTLAGPAKKEPTNG